jgi:hypothetical protein
LRSFMAPKAMDWELRPCAKVSKNPWMVAGAEESVWYFRNLKEEK